VIVTVFPPPVGPAFGATLVIAGAPNAYRSPLVCALGPASVVTNTGTVPAACAGATTFNCVLDTKVVDSNDPALENFAFAPGTNPDPLIVTVFPPPVGPAFGATLVIAGGVKPNEAPSRDVKQAALEKVPPSGCTVTTPLGWMNKRPLVALHRSTGTYTLLAGRKPTGNVNGTGLVPPVAIAPSKWTTPPRMLTAAFEVPNGAFVHPLASVSAVNPVPFSANDAPSRDVKQAALEKVPPSGCTVTTPLGWMNKRPLVALHRSTGTYTLVAGRKPTGNVNGTGLVPPVAIAPSKWTTPPMVLTAAFEVPNGAFVHPLASVSAVNPVPFSANDAPSRDVKQAALEKVPPSGCTVTTPLGWMNKRPLVALHRSTGTYTLVAGRKPTGNVNGTGLVPPVAIAPWKITIPETLDTPALLVPNGAFVHPFCNTSGVNVAASAEGTPRIETINAAQSARDIRWDVLSRGLPEATSGLGGCPDGVIAETLDTSVLLSTASARPSITRDNECWDPVNYPYHFAPHADLTSPE
jgi:hypothetical protein